METLSGFLSEKRTNNVEQKYLTRNQEPERNFEDVIPDGIYFLAEFVVCLSLLT